jgi:hypothetical protein
VFSLHLLCRTVAPLYRVKLTDYWCIVLQAA